MELDLPNVEIEEPKPAGDVVVSLDTLRRQAREYGISEEEELKRLLIHGILHLKGMTHGEKDEGMIQIQ